MLTQQTGLSYGAKPTQVPTFFWIGSVQAHEFVVFFSSLLRCQSEQVRRRQPTTTTTIAAESSMADDEALRIANENEDKDRTNPPPSPSSSSSSDALAKGISSLLTTVIKDFDCRAEDTLKSQDQLSSSIDRLTRELDQLLEDAPLPFVMQHATKISGVRKRVLSLNSVLKSIQRRVDNIDRMLSVGLKHEKSSRESTGKH